MICPDGGGYGWYFQKWGGGSIYENGGGIGPEHTLSIYWQKKWWNIPNYKKVCQYS